MSETTLRLKWIPVDFSELQPPAGFSLVEEALWWRAIKALFYGEPQGYVPHGQLPLMLNMRTNRDRRCWDAHGAIVTSALCEKQLAGQRMVFSPALNKLLDAQRRKLHRKGGGSGLSPPGPAQPADALSHSGLDLNNSKTQRERGITGNQRRDPNRPTGAVCLDR
jgi:hypothetical protein